MDQFAQLVEKILDIQQKKGSAFVAISGLGGSGKTFLTKKLEAALLESRIIYVDDFYKTEEERGDVHSSENIISNCFDWDRIENVIRLFQEGKAVCYQKYNWEKNIREGWVEMYPQSITILEGIYSLQDRFLPYYDLSVWVEAPRELRRERIINRDQEWKRKWLDTWMEQDDRYFALEQPAQKAHIIYSGI